MEELPRGKRVVVVVVLAVRKQRGTAWGESDDDGSASGFAAHSLKDRGKGRLCGCVCERLSSIGHWVPLHVLILNLLLSNLNPFKSPIESIQD